MAVGADKSSDVSGPQQLSLEVRLRDDATFANFYGPSAQACVHALQTQMDAGGEQAVYLWGGSGSGKSHLLQACCHASPSLYLPLAELRDYPAAEVLHSAEVMARVCVDDLHLIAGRAEWELALFHFINRARERACNLVFAADAAPRSLPLQLPDLQSRLAWGAVYALPRLSDEDKAAILQFRAERRGLVLSDAVCRYIIGRAPREMHELLDLLDKLDAASLRQKRALSKPFIKQTLGW